MCELSKIFFLLLLIWGLHQIVENRKINRRSPRKHGYVTFAEPVQPKFIFNVTRHPEQEPTKALEFHKLTHISEWVPGHVKSHSYIPAHIHHVFIPLIVTLKPPVTNDEDDNEYYPKLVGGYAVGQDYGGQGAGHGFQISFDSIY